MGYEITFDEFSADSNSGPNFAPTPTRAALTMAELAEASAAAVILIHCPSQFTADVLHQSKVVYKGGCPCAA